MGAGASSDQSVKIQHSAEYTKHHSNVANWSKSRHPLSPVDEKDSHPKIDPLDRTKDGIWEIRAVGESLTGRWDSYPEDIVERLEAALKDKKEDCQIVVGGKLFSVHFASMTQKGHGGAREVRRVIKAADGTLVTPERSRVNDPFAFQENDSTALFASPSTSTYAAGDEDLADGARRSSAEIIASSRYKAVLHSTIQAHSEAVYGINFSLDGDKIITGSKDGTCKFWESSTSYLISSFAKHPGAVLSTVLSKSTSLAATGCDDDIARVFDLKKSGQDVEPILKLEGHTHKVYTVNFLDSHTLLSGSMDNDLRLWDLNKGVCSRVISAHESSVFFSCVSPRSKNVVLSASDDCSMVQHDFREKDSVVARFAGHEKTLWGCDIRFDEGQYVSCGMDAKVMLWDPRNSSTPTNTFCVHKSPIHSVEYLPDGTGILSAARDHCFKIIECQRGDTVLSTAAHEGNVFRANYNPVTNLVMTCGTDTKVKLWSLEQ